MTVSRMRRPGRFYARTLTRHRPVVGGKVNLDAPSAPMNLVSSMASMPRSMETDVSSHEGRVSESVMNEVRPDIEVGPRCASFGPLSCRPLSPSSVSPSRPSGVPESSSRSSSTRWLSRVSVGCSLVLAEASRLVVDQLATERNVVGP